MIDIATTAFSIYLAILLLPAILMIGLVGRAIYRSIRLWYRNRLAGDWYRNPVRYSLQQLSDHDSTDRYWIGR